MAVAAAALVGAGAIAIGGAEGAGKSGAAKAPVAQSRTERFATYETPQELLRVRKYLDMVTLEVGTISEERSTPVAPGGFSRSYVVVSGQVVDPLVSGLAGGSEAKALWPTSEPDSGAPPGRASVPFHKGDRIVAFLASAWPEQKPIGRWLTAALMTVDGSSVQRAAPDGTYPEQRLADVTRAKVQATLNELVELDRKYQPDRRARAALYEAARERVAEYKATYVPAGEPPAGYVATSAVVAPMGDDSASSRSTGESSSTSVASSSEKAP